MCFNSSEALNIKYQILSTFAQLVVFVLIVVLLSHLSQLAYYRYSWVSVCFISFSIPKNAPLLGYGGVVYYRHRNSLDIH